MPKKRTETLAIKTSQGIIKWPVKFTRRNGEVFAYGGEEPDDGWTREFKARERTFRLAKKKVRKAIEEWAKKVDANTLEGFLKTKEEFLKRKRREQ